MDPHNRPWAWESSGSIYNWAPQKLPWVRGSPLTLTLCLCPAAPFLSFILAFNLFACLLLSIFFLFSIPLLPCLYISASIYLSLNWRESSNQQGHASTWLGLTFFLYFLFSSPPPPTPYICLSIHLFSPLSCAQFPPQSGVNRWPPTQAGSAGARAPPMRASPTYRHWQGAGLWTEEDSESRHTRRHQPSLGLHTHTPASASPDTNPPGSREGAEAQAPGTTWGL